MDIDNLTFAVLLPEKLRAHVEAHGQVELTIAQATALARTKPVHVVVIGLAVLAGVASASFLFCFFGPFAAFLLAAEIETFGTDCSVNACKIHAGIWVASFSGMITFLFMLALSTN